MTIVNPRTLVGPPPFERGLTRRGRDVAATWPRRKLGRGFVMTWTRQN